MSVVNTLFFTAILDAVLHTNIYVYTA